jgi:hypothetical protein
MELHVAATVLAAYWLEEQEQKNSPLYKAVVIIPSFFCSSLYLPLFQDWINIPKSCSSLHGLETSSIHISKQLFLSDSCQDA